MHQIVSRRGFAPDQLGELTSLPKTPSWFGGGVHGEREGGRGGEKEGGEGRGGKGREGRGGRPGMPKSRVGKPSQTPSKRSGAAASRIILRPTTCTHTVHTGVPLNSIFVIALRVFHNTLCSVLSKLLCVSRHTDCQQNRHSNLKGV